MEYQKCVIGTRELGDGVNQLKANRLSEKSKSCLNIIWAKKKLRNLKDRKTYKDRRFVKI